MGNDVLHSGPASVQFADASKIYPDGTVAVENLSLQVNAEELVTLVGPSGCGKSTSLRMVNRLIVPTSGAILIDGEDIAASDPVQLRRQIGYVIQHVGLFPHRTVGQNVATVPRLLGWDRDRIKERVAELLQLVGLEPDKYSRRYPHELSGGQRQRVGVARALAADPPVLLMDEPFGAVDPIGRRRLQSEFRRIQQEVRTTVLFVTHDLDEAVLLADRVAVFSQGGKLEQFADPVTLLAQPETEFVREFIGEAATVRLLSLTQITANDLGPVAGAEAPGEAAAPGEIAAPGEAALQVGQTLDVGLNAITIAADGVVPVADNEGNTIGTLDAQHLHAALKRAVRRNSESPGATNEDLKRNGS
ncbi:MAG TPA: ATP-binding cassette domain-containing protein [Actinomycetales bacterium]|nr:ATP-binding cassette domain-containing protein [Actinomycetales bacterium]